MDSLKFGEYINWHLPSSYLVIKTWRILWSLFSRNDLLKEGIWWWLLCLGTMKPKGGMRQKGKSEGRDKAAVSSLVAILILQDFLLLMLPHLINLCVILKYFAMLWWLETCSLTTQHFKCKLFPGVVVN